MRQIEDQHRSIVKDLIGRLPQNTGGLDTRPAWTKGVKDTMHALCRKYLRNDGEFCASHVDKFTGSQDHEWLLDVLWYYNNGDEERIVLGLESEWDDDTSAVRTDFAKLLALKAPVKIMIFESGRNSKAKVERHLAELTDVCRKWSQHSAGDKIYLLNFHDGEHDAHYAEVGTSGSIPEFSFERLSELSGKDSGKAS